MTKSHVSLSNGLQSMANIFKGLELIYAHSAKCVLKEIMRNKYIYFLAFYTVELDTNPKFSSMLSERLKFYNCRREKV